MTDENHTDYLKDLNPAALYVMWTLEEQGYETRLCGGAVRDLVSGKTPKDWDMATVAYPNTVMDIFEKLGKTVIPTGLQHGTVTVVIGDENIEITTLRVDTKTDGRHADVEYTDDWRQDSSRRDFTMNAMYIDCDGILHDYHGGLGDIKDRNFPVFVGEPDARIKEDYLRILRWFRFHDNARCGILRGHDHTDVDYAVTCRTAIRDNLHGLDTISGERIWAELKKMMSSDMYIMSLSRLSKLGIFEKLGLHAPTDLTHGMNAQIRKSCTNPVVRLFYSSPRYILDIGRNVLVNRFHASSEEVGILDFVIKHYDDVPVDIVGSMILLGRGYSKEMVKNRIAIMPPVEAPTEVTPTTVSAMERIFDQIDQLQVPEFPISGNDIMGLGVAAGPNLGEILGELRDYWSKNTFVPDKENLLGLANDIIQRDEHHDQD